MPSYGINKLSEVERRAINLYNQKSPSGHSLEQELSWIRQNIDVAKNQIELFAKENMKHRVALSKIRLILKKENDHEKAKEAIEEVLNRENLKETTSLPAEYIKEHEEKN